MAGAHVDAGLLGFMWKFIAVSGKDVWEACMRQTSGGCGPVAQRLPSMCEAMGSREKNGPSGHRRRKRRAYFGGGCSSEPFEFCIICII